MNRAIVDKFAEYVASLPPREGEQAISIACEAFLTKTPGLMIHGTQQPPDRIWQACMDLISQQTEVCQTSVVLSLLASLPQIAITNLAEIQPRLPESLSVDEQISALWQIDAIMDALHQHAMRELAKLS